jgi:hypothetical protein
MRFTEPTYSVVDYKLKQLQTTVATPMSVTLKGFVTIPQKELKTKGSNSADSILAQYYRFLHSFSVSNILQLPDDVHPQLSTSAIKLKYDQLTCVICDCLLLRLCFTSQIAKMCT